MDVIAQTDAFFAGKPEAWLVFETIKEKMIARWPQTQLRVMKTCIVFEDKKPYLYVSYPPRKGMRGVWLSISLRERVNHPRFAMVVPVSARRFTAHIHIEEADQVDEALIRLIERARNVDKPMKS